MGKLLQDIRYGLRGLLRSPGITAVAVLSLALGIGANSAIFSFVDALLLKSLPVHDPHSLVFFGPANGSGNSDGFPDDSMNLFSYAIYREMAEKNQVFSGVAAVSSYSFDVHGTLENSAELEGLSVQMVSGTFFQVLGLKPLMGRLFTDADDQVLGGHPIAVISYDWWTSRFAQDPAILGKTFRIDDTIYTIIGVAPRGFAGTTVGEQQDAWVPLQMADVMSQGPHKLNDKYYRWLDIIARRKPGVSVATARVNVNVVLKEILQEYAGSQPSAERLQDIQKANIELTPAAAGKSLLREQFADPLWILMGIVALVLLISCANIANLLLARGTVRQREIAVRMALGAGRGRLVRQFLTESLVLGGIGGAMGIVFSAWATQALLEMVSPKGDLISLDVAPNGRVLAFTLLISTATVLLFGIIPALRTSNVAPNSSLASGRSAAAGARRGVLGKALIVGQVALSLVLLIGAGLFVRSLINLAHVNPGFQTQNVLEFGMDSRASGFTDEAHMGNFYREVEERTNAIPGVKASSFTIFVFNQGSWNEDAWPEDTTTLPRVQNTIFNAVGPGYFATLGLPVLEGRALGPEDTANSPRVAVINETMERRFFSGVSPIGKRIGIGDATSPRNIEIVGVVRNSKFLNLEEDNQSIAYFPYTQYVPDWGIGLYLGHLQVRYAGDAQTVIAGVRAAVSAVNARVPIVRVETLEDRVDNSVASRRLVAQLSGFFGLLAVFLACIGIFGLMSFAVTRRTNEIGIRMALGANRANVVGMVMREVLILVGIGVAIGIPAALACDRWAASMLFGLKPTDPATMTAATTLLLAIALLAGYLPARRAAKVDPMVALRYE
ncbi:MAG TPA: ABC transporter permease [Candidatus Acidoferrales bacterium]|nr:ABC transporter permease [Candidatus Acidoferrales bacterium]